jgi:hypothetical protein
MSKIYIKVPINLSDAEYCYNPKIDKWKECKRLQWNGDYYVCDAYERKLKNDKYGSVKRPKFCRDREVKEEL